MADLEERSRAWFVIMYSPYWRRLIAFYRGHSDQGIILQAADPDELERLMHRVAPHWQDHALPQFSWARPYVTEVPELMATLPTSGGHR